MNGNSLFRMEPPGTLGGFFFGYREICRLLPAVLPKTNQQFTLARKIEAILLI
jgi:hypothetical protein